MTFEEFKELALNPPQYIGGTVYRVEVYGYYDEWIDDSGCYGLVKANTSYYTSHSDAQRALSEIYRSVCKDDLKIYCTLIFEIPTGIDMRFEKYTCVLSYDSDCNLIDKTLCAYPRCVNDENLETLRGRSQNMIRFQPGDIVEVMTLWSGEPYVETAIITKSHLTIEDSWGIYEQLGDLFVDGNESDEYCYLTGEHWLSSYNSSTAPFLVFKPHVHVPDKRKKELLDFYNNFTGHAFYREGGSRLDEIAQCTAGLSADTYPGFNSLTPSDFDPIYNASEVIHIFETVDFYIENPLDSILNRIEEITNSALFGFLNFIICISNTDWHGKRLNPKRISEWKEKLKIVSPIQETYYGEREL